MAQHLKKPGLFKQFLPYTPEKELPFLEIFCCRASLKEQRETLTQLESGKTFDDIMTSEVAESFSDSDAEVFRKGRAQGLTLKEAVEHVEVANKDIEAIMRDYGETDPETLRDMVKQFFDWWYTQKKTVPTWDDLDYWGPQGKAEKSRDRLFGSIEEPPAGLPTELKEKWPDIRKWLSLIYSGPLAPILGSYLRQIAQQTQALQKKEHQLDQEAQELQALRMTPSPTSMIQYFQPLFPTRKGNIAIRKQKLFAKASTKEIHNGSKTKMEVTVQLIEGTQAIMDFDRVTGTTDRVVDLWMQKLAWLGTETFLSAMCCLKMCTDRGKNMFAENVQRLCKMRGLSTAWANRKAIKNHLTRLVGVKFRVTALQDGDGVIATMPLLMDAGEAQGVKGNRKDRRKARLYSFHSLLWDTMVIDRRMTWYDNAILKANAHNDAWAIHIYFWLTRQWGQGWAKNRLHAQGGRTTPFRMETIARQAGIEIDWSRPKSVNRKHFQADCAKLLNPGWSTYPLIADWSVDPHPTDPAQDKYTFTPTQTHIDYIGATNTKRVAAFEKNLLIQGKKQGKASKG